MTFRLGGELSERFAALAPVAGMLAVNDAKPKKPLPTLYIIGTKDPLQPLAGGDVQLPWGKRSNRPVAEYLAGWSKAIGCEPEPRTVSEENGLKRVEYPSRTGDRRSTSFISKVRAHLAGRQADASWDHGGTDHQQTERHRCGLGVFQDGSPR